MKEDFNHIKKRLRDYESPIHLDEAWEALQEQQQKRQGKWKRTATVLLLLLLIGSCGTCLLLGKRNGSHMPLPTQEVVFQDKDVPVEQQNSSISGASNAHHAIRENATLTQTNQHTTSAVGQSSIASNFSDKPSLSTYNFQKQSSNSSDNTQKTDTSNKNMLSISSPAPAQSSVYEQGPVSGSTSSAVIPENDRTDSDARPLQEKAGNDLTWVAPAPAMPAPWRMWWIDVLPEKTFGMTARPSQTLLLPLVKIDLSPIRPARKTAIRKTVYLSAGALLTQQNFKSRTTEQAEYAALRSRTESGLPGLSTDLGISLEVSQRNYVDLALRYDTWYDQFVYQYEQSKEYTLTNVLLGVVQYEPIGTQVRVYGDTVITGTQTVKATYYNRYAAADLRLAFGRTLWESHRFSLDMTAGMSANIYKKIQGHIADSGLANNVMDLQHMPYKQTLGLGAYADLRLNYRLASWLDLQLRPSAILGLSDALQSNAPSSAHFRRTSLQLGLRTRF